MLKIKSTILTIFVSTLCFGQHVIIDLSNGFAKINLEDIGLQETVNDSLFFKMNSGTVYSFHNDDINLMSFNKFTLDENEASLNSINKFETLVVYPNPARNVLNLQLDSNTSIDKVEIYSLSGEKVISKSSLSVNLISLETSSLQVGPYLMKISYGDKVISKIIVIN